MKLKVNPSVKNWLWQNYSDPMMQKLGLSLEEHYPHIFAFQDYKSLLSLQNEEVQALIFRMQKAFLEAYLELNLQENFQSIPWRCEPSDDDEIQLPSQFALGRMHKIREAEDGGFLWSIGPSFEQKISDFEAVVQNIFNFEKHEFEKRRLTEAT